jgi:tetratricopeptide (TPR) repeat protein
VILLLLQGARGEMPLPSFPDELARQRWIEVDGILTEGCATDQFPVKCGQGIPDRAIAHADAFQKAIREDAGLEYLAGLACRYAGREDEAIRRYRHAIQLDPKRAEAWYDLGEIYQIRADLPAAREAFEQVSTLRSTGDLAWIGPWRLAEVGAMAHDPDAFERDLKEALRRGFSFRHVAGQPHWKAFYQDPALRDTLDKMLTVYAEPDVRALFEP